MELLRNKNNGRFSNIYKYGGKQNKRLHSIWSTMLKRCNNPSFVSYKLYGGRGIHICLEWFNYDLFAEWALSHGYKCDLQIDRIDNDGNYEPDNCRWVTCRENANNRRSTTFYTFNGITKSLKNWARDTGIHYRTLHNRVKLLNWSIDKALHTPVRKGVKNGKS